MGSEGLVSNIEPLAVSAGRRETRQNLQMLTTTTCLVSTLAATSGPAYKLHKGNAEALQRCKDRRSNPLPISYQERVCGKAY